jgi:hypothetical protein
MKGNYKKAKNSRDLIMKGVKYGILITDADEDWDHMEFHMYNTPRWVFNTLEKAEKKIEELNEDEEYHYQTFKVVQIFSKR